jgi:eukaryotic-like serine/threonine-protein kinase
VGSTAAPHGYHRPPESRESHGTNCATVRVNGPGDDKHSHGLALIWPQVRGYEILSVIGTGGMGIVFKARHRDLNRTVALKMLRGASLDDPEFRDRFQTEAEAVARLQHPNIIQVFETGSAKVSPDGRLDAPFISLEYVDGGSLARLTDRPQPPPDAAKIVAKLAEATAAAHKFGVVHRDLKPANILLTDEGEPKIADFGLAKQLTVEPKPSERFVTQAGMIIGTPEYMAPEQAVGAAPTPAVDVYALGVILYELLTGRVPFQGAHAIDTMALVRTQDPVSARRLQPTVPRDLDTICNKCLEKDPARRYWSAQALADDLNLFQDGKPIRARQISATERTVRWCRRNPVVAASVAGVAAIFLAAFILVSRSYWRAEAALQNEAAERQKAEEREKAERWERYQANILSGASALQVDNVAAAHRVLETAPAEYRGWEFEHFQSRLDSAKIVLGGVDGPADNSVVFANGRRVVMYSGDNRVDVWDPLARSHVIGFREVDGQHNPAATSDGRLFANNQADGSIVLRDVDTNAVKTVLRGHQGEVTSIKYFNENKRVMTRATDNTIRIWDVETGEQLRVIRGPVAELSVSVLSPDGRRLVAGTKSGGIASSDLELWDLATNSRIARMPGDGRHIIGSIFSPDGKWLVTVGDRGDYTLRIWDGESGARVTAVTGHSNRAAAIAFSPDGTLMASGSFDQTIEVTEIKTGRLIHVLKGHRGWVNGVAFSRDGQRLASASQDHTVRLWNAVSGDLIEVLHGHTGEVHSVDFSADGETIISSAGDGTVRIWDRRLVEANGILRGHSSYVYSVAVHPDGERVASASWDGTARVWEATTGRQLAVLNHGPAEEFVVAAVAFQPGGRLLATCCRDIAHKGRDFVGLWDVDSGKEVHRWPTRSDVWRDTRVAISPDGRFLAAGLGWDSVRVWDVESKSEYATFGPFKDMVRDVAFSPDGRWLATAAEDCTIRVWDVAARTPVCTLEGHTLAAYAVTFSPDGKWLASGSIDGSARIWDTGSWTQVTMLKHQCKVYGLSFSPDGSRLACGCLDNAVHLWDTGTFREVAELRGHTSYVHSVAFTPDGTRLISGSGDFTVRVWDTLAPQVRAARKP